MKRTIFYLLIIFNSMLLFSWTLNNKFPTEGVIENFKQLLSTSTYITIPSESIKEVKDTTLNKLLSDIRFFSLIVSNSSHWEYNKGSINVVAAISTKDTNDIRLLLPQDYARSSSNFFDLFYDINIIDKEKFSKSITNLLLKTYVFHPLNCDTKMSQLQQSYLSKKDTSIVTISWVNECWDLNGNRGDLIKYFEYKKTIFTFSEDQLKKIEFNDWSE